MPTKESSSRDRIVAYLESQGGAISNEEGRGLTQALASAAGYSDLSVLNGMLSRLEREGVIVRDVRGRRTYQIALGSGANGTAATAGASRSTTRRRQGRSTTATPPKPGARRRAAGKRTAPAPRVATARPAGASLDETGRKVGAPPMDMARLDATDERLDKTEQSVRRAQHELAELTARLESVEAAVAEVARLATRLEALERAPQSASAPRKGLFSRR